MALLKCCRHNFYDCKNLLIKNRAPEKSFKFPPKIYKDSRKKSGEIR